MQTGDRYFRWRHVFLLVLFLLSLYYLYRAVTYRFIVPGRMGPPNPVGPAW